MTTEEAARIEFVCQQREQMANDAAGWYGQCMALNEMLEAAKKELEVEQGKIIDLAPVLTELHEAKETVKTLYNLLSPEAKVKFDTRLSS